MQMSPTRITAPRQFPAIDFVRAAKSGSEARRSATPSISAIRSIAVVAEQALTGNRIVRDTKRGRVIQAARAAAQIAAWRIGNALSSDAKLTSADEAAAEDAAELLEILASISSAEGDAAAQSEWLELAEYTRHSVLRPVWLARMAD